MLNSEEEGDCGTMWKMRAQVRHDTQKEGIQSLETSSTMGKKPVSVDT